MSAFKFYNDYALKTNDKKKILERYEDRISIVALFFANGDTEKAKEYVNLMINQEYQPSTPTFLNAGRKRRGELVSCFLLEVNDSLNDISRAIDISMQLSKLGGGVSLNLSKLRAKGEAIKDVENATKGVVGVMKLLDNAFRYADQMGQRQGSGAAYLNIFHRDINDFLDTKKISADEDVRVKTLSIGVVIPDKFVELAREDKAAYVFYPHTIYKEYGQHMDEMDMNEMYDKFVDNPRVKKEKINRGNCLKNWRCFVLNQAIHTSCSKITSIKCMRITIFPRSNFLTFALKCCRHLKFLHTQTMMKKMKSVWIFPATWVRLTFSMSWSINQSKRQSSLRQTL